MIQCHSVAIDIGERLRDVQIAASSATTRNHQSWRFVCVLVVKPDDAVCTVNRVARLGEFFR